MIVCLWYTFTAAIVLTGCEILRFLLPPLAPGTRWAQRGAMLLLVAAVVHFWNRRVAAGMALFATVLIWPSCWFVASLSVTPINPGLNLWMILEWLPAIAFIACILLPTTIYSFLLVTGIYKEMRLPPWLFSEDAKPTQAVSSARSQEKPAPVRVAAFLLYALWAVAVATVLYSFGPHLQNLVFPVVLFQVVVLGALLWLVREVASGKHWARITLLAIFLLQVFSMAKTALSGATVARSSQLESGSTLLVFVVYGAAMILLFSKASTTYFRPLGK